MQNFDVIVVGSGHAGVEAALAASRMGASCLLLTMNADQIATMSCNPAIGGLGKSQLAKELDVLGGAMAQVADLSAMQYRILNEKKGPAVRATRVQVDRHEYRSRMKFLIESTEGLRLAQAQVQKLIFSGNRLKGVETSTGQQFFAKAIVITTGTFMNGKAHIGKQNFSTGRAGEAASIGLSDFLRSLGITIGRFKTGTVPRVDARTINYKILEEQGSHDSALPLSVFSDSKRTDLVAAHLSYTNERTHEIIRNSLDQSPLYSGLIEGRGPRYCPSVEDKVVKFNDKDRHQIFLEQEGRFTNEVYVGGLSTSLPFECQIEFLQTIRGLENVEIIRPGYAIEYDFIDATQLKPSLEMKEIENLFFAGQVNGTSGYEEAAAQGLMAGANAAARVQGREPLILTRGESYIGVLVDDLTSISISEPYRMLSSRAEWRLLLREDNADHRLMKFAVQHGLLTDKKRETLEKRLELRTRLLRELDELLLFPTGKTNGQLAARHESPIRQRISLRDFIKRPGVDSAFIGEMFSELYVQHEPQIWEAIITDIKYEGYLKQSESQLRQLEKMNRLRIPSDFNFSDLKGLTREAQEKLSRLRPSHLGQASRVEGVTPAALSLLAIHLTREKTNHETKNVSCELRQAFD